jgi:hypothetical protein
MRRACLMMALLVFILAVPGSAGGRSPGDKHGGMPSGVIWDYGAWADDYLVVGTAYDPDARQITWTLEARKKVTARPYRARFTDPDLLEMAARDIHFTPAHKDYLKGNRIKATLKLPDKDVMQEVNRVTIGSAE